MNKIKFVLRTAMLTIAATMTTLPGFSWDKKGHDITAAIAQRHLTPTARQKINELLDGRTIVYWAPWMDDASNMPEYRYSKTWHYLDIAKGKDVTDFVNSCENVITAINSQIEILRSNSRSKEEKALALKFITHLMGDLHQPLHLGYPEDKGGNTVRVKFFNHDTSLHSMWDGQLTSRAHDWSHTEWAEELDINNDPQFISSITSGTLLDWARQSHVHAEAIYAGTSTTDNLSFEYVRTWAPVIEQQFLYGGLRLAHILNNIFN
ncbi:MAG: S1/P1 nuclease [Bacteroidaceae bacterium]|nr:S1/P1 nuclease [Bacteroidaceae bacterium]